MLLPWVVDGITTYICNWCGRCYCLGGLDVIATRVDVVLADGIAKSALLQFKFWDVMQNLIPYVWQMVLANVFVKGWIINSDIQSFFYGSQEVLTFSSHYFKVVNGDIVTRDGRMVMNGGRGLEMFFKPLCKVSCWLTNVFFFTVHPVAFISIYGPTLFPDASKCI